MPFGFHSLHDLEVFLVLTLPLLLLALTFHEFGHALVADLMGDPTPRQAGRLTLNPIAHLDPLGTLLMIFAHIGWAKPVPVDPRNLPKRWGPFFVSLAGPAANLLLAVATLALLKHVLHADSIDTTTESNLVEFAGINLGLMLFNLLPIPPLDGFQLWNGFLPAAWRKGFYDLLPYGVVALAVIYFFPSTLAPLGTAIDSLLGMLWQVV